MNRKTVFWQMAGACGIWLGFPNDLIFLPCLVFVWPVSLMVLGLEAHSARNAFLNGWLTAFAGSCAAMYWLAFPMHDVASLPWLVAFACAFCVTGVLATASGFFTALVFVARAQPSLALALLLALAWTSLESAYAEIFGCPWLPLAGALAPWPILVQPAALVGVFGTSGLWIFVLACIVLITLNVERRDLYTWLGAICGISLLLLYGTWRLTENPLETEPANHKSLHVLFVDGNINQNQKWLPAFQHKTLEAYLRLTNDALAQSDGKPQLIIWPETAMPFFFDASPILSGLIRDVASLNNCSLIFGAPGLDMHGVKPGQSANDQHVFNRAYLIAPDGSDAGHYDKEHLVPFGEYVPDWIKFDFLSGLLQEVGIYEPGNNGAPLRQGPLALGMLICYEGIFPWLAQQRVENGANILVDISNDGWFSGTPAARQHLYLTCLRAIEQNRWILRGTNSGISAAIDNLGRITRQTAEGKDQSLAVTARLCSDLSPYHRWKHLFFLICCLPLILSVPGCRMFCQRLKNDKE